MLPSQSESHGIELNIEQVKENETHRPFLALKTLSLCAWVPLFIFLPWFKKDVSAFRWPTSFLIIAISLIPIKTHIALCHNTGRAKRQTLIAPANKVKTGVQDTGIFCYAFSNKIGTFELSISIDLVAFRSEREYRVHPVSFQLELKWSLTWMYKKWTSRFISFLYEPEPMLLFTSL